MLHNGTNNPEKLELMFLTKLYLDQQKKLKWTNPKVESLPKTRFL